MGFIHVKRLSVTIIGKDKTGKVVKRFDTERDGFVTSTAMELEGENSEIAKLDKQYPGLKWEYDIMTID